MKLFEFIIALVMVVGFFSYLRHRAGLRASSGEPGGDEQRLREEIRQLKERIKVLERITVDREQTLAREIDSLRDD